MRNTLITHIGDKNLPDPKILNELQKMDLRDVVIIDRHAILDRQKILSDILLHNAMCDENNPDNKEGYNTIPNLTLVYNSKQERRDYKGTTAAEFADLISEGPARLQSNNSPINK